MRCDECRWNTERNDCPCGFEYKNTDYAEDCVDFRNVNFPETVFKDK